MIISMRSTYCILLKLTTNKHEASRGLSTTAELLVEVWGGSYPSCCILTAPLDAAVVAQRCVNNFHVNVSADSVQI